MGVRWKANESYCHASQRLLLQHMATAVLWRCSELQGVVAKDILRHVWLQSHGFLKHIEHNILVQRSAQRQELQWKEVVPDALLRHKEELQVIWKLLNSGERINRILEAGLVCRIRVKWLQKTSCIYIKHLFVDSFLELNITITLISPKYVIKYEEQFCGNTGCI